MAYEELGKATPAASALQRPQPGPPACLTPSYFADAQETEAASVDPGMTDVIRTSTTS